MLHLEPRAIDLLDDCLDGGGPDKWLGIVVPGLHEVVDRLFDEAAAAKRLVRQFSEPALHQVEPAGTGRNEVTDELQLIDGDRVDRSRFQFAFD